MDFNNFLKLVKKRRSIRKFKSDPIPDEYIEKIIEATRWTPSAANSQPWEFIVVKEKGLREKIVELFKETSEISKKMELTRKVIRHPVADRPIGDPGFKNAPVLIVVCGDPRTKESYPINSPADKNFYTSLANAVLYMLLAATSLGLGAQYVTSSSNPYMESQLKALLNIPEAFRIYEMIPIGYPDEKPRDRMVRELKEIIHYDKFDDQRLKSDDDVRKFIRTIHSR